MFNLPEIPPGGDFNLFTLIIGFAMSLWGGIISVMMKMRAGMVGYSFREFAIEISISLFAGYVVFVFCIWAGVPVHVAGALAGLGGHNGTRTIFYLNKLFFKGFSKAKVD
ncbi:MAG TPA: phage holin family protein [Cellvibrionaceae bacterium]